MEEGMSTTISIQQDANLDLTGFIISGKKLLQKCEDVNNKISGLIEDAFSQYFLEIDPKISEFYQTIQSKKIKILDSEKLNELKAIVTSLQMYQPQIQKISKIFIDSILTKIEDLQCVQQLLGLTTDSEKAQVYLNRGIAYFNQKKYDKTISACSQAITLKQDLAKAYLYRKASLDALSSTERKKAIVDIATTSCNFQLCGLTDSDIDDIMDALEAIKDEAITLKLCCNLLTSHGIEKLLILAKKNPFVNQIEYETGQIFNETMRELYTTLQENQNRYLLEKEKRFNTDFYIAYTEGQDHFQKERTHESIHCFLKALNRELHHPVGLKSLISALQKQQHTFSCHEKAITGILSLNQAGFITSSLDGTLLKWGVDGPVNQFNWKQTKPQEITTVIHLNGSQIVSGHSNGMIIVWDLLNKEPIQVFEKTHTKAIVQLLRLTDTQFVSYDNLTLKYWDMQIKGKELISTVNETRATAFDVLSDGTLVLGDAKGILRFLDIHNSDKGVKEIDTKYSGSPITKIKQLTKDNFVIGYGDGFLQVFESKTKKLIPIKVTSDSTRSIAALALLNEKHWVSGSQDGLVKVFILDENNTCVSRFEANSAVTSLCVDYLSEQIYIGCEDGTLHTWLPLLKTVVPIDDDSLLKPFKIDGDLVTITKDSKGRDDMIERGGGGIVYKGLYNKKLVAVKEARRGEEKNLLAEIKVMAQMHDYPTVLSLEAMVQEQDRLQLVMELMSQGSLTSFLKKTVNLPWENRWVLMMDIVYGLLCLHANNIVHRDVKSGNILINNNRARISDFGTSRKNTKTHTTNIIGSLGYLDPWLDENKNDRNTEKSDIYSLGNVLWELLNENYQEPWQDIQNFGDYKRRLVDNNEKLKLSDKTPPTLKTFLPSLWERFRNKRPNITTVFEKIVTSREEFKRNDTEHLFKEMAQACLKQGIDYYNQGQYEKAFTTCSQAIALKGDLEKAYLYRKAALDGLSPTERKKCLVTIATTTGNFQLCGINESDIDDISVVLMANKEEAVTLNFCHNVLTNKCVEKLLTLAQNNPYVIQLEYEIGEEFNFTDHKLRGTLHENQDWYFTDKEKRLNADFFIAHREGKNQLKNGDIDEAIHYFLKALNCDLHNPVGIESLLEALYRQQRTFLYHQDAVTGIVCYDKILVTGSLDGTLRIGNLEDTPLSFDWKQIKLTGRDITTAFG